MTDKQFFKIWKTIEDYKSLMRDLIEKGAEGMNSYWNAANHCQRLIQKERVKIINNKK